MTDEQAKLVAEIAKRETDYPTMRAQADQESIEFLLALVRKLDAERRRLAALVAQLPVTTDGVPILPEDDVYLVRRATGNNATAGGIEKHAVHSVGWGWIELVEVEREIGMPSDCVFSTRDAALAAAGEPAPTIEAAPSPPPEPERVLADYVGTYRIGPNAPETWADDHLIGVEPDGSTWMLQDGSEKRERFWSWKAVAGFASRGEFRKL